jgi:hypothetical protein
MMRTENRNVSDPFGSVEENVMITKSRRWWDGDVNRAATNEMKWRAAA